MCLFLLGYSGFRDYYKCIHDYRRRSKFISILGPGIGVLFTFSLITREYIKFLRSKFLHALLFLHDSLNLLYCYSL